MRVHRFAIAAAVATFVLTIFGGVVSVTESGLACPDWPLCEGKFIPQMVDGKQYEHSHRLVASFVAAMTFGLLALLLKYRRRQPHLVKLGVVAAVLVTIQALLGAATVIYRLPWAVVSAHLAVATGFLVLLTSLAWLTHPDRGELPVAQRPLSRPISAVALLLFVQVVGGGVMRHLRAGLACGLDLPWCHGSLWPLDGWVGVQIHLVHRFLGVACGLAVLGLVGWLWRRPEASRQLKVVAAIAGVGVLAQLALGGLTVLRSRELFTINAHSSLGIGLMAVVTWMYWLAARAAGRQRAAESPGCTPLAAAVEA